MNIGEMVEVYQTIASERRKLKREFDDADTKLKADEERIELAILKFLQDSNINSVRTDFGTAYRQEDVIPTCADWNVFYDWVKKNNAFDALEKRIKKTYVKEMLENDGELPAGVDVIRKFVVRIRRS